MLKGFRDFILRGNVIDLAVAVVIGAAFTALVGAVATGLIDPLVRVMLGGSADNLGGTVTINGQVLDFGLIINAVITFLITAAVVYFIFVAPMNKYRAMREAGKDTAEEMEAKEVVLLQEIRDLLQQRNGGEDRLA
jgi:large conductance mechanosensitive channel